MFDLNYAIPMMVLLRLSLPVRILIIGSTKLSLKNMVNLWMIVLLDLNTLLVAYVLVIHLHILLMNVLNSCYMLLMILCEA
jgi:hypothetical protein